MTPMQQTRRTRRHDDTPDTAAFRRMAELSDGPERDEIRGRIVSAWMPMAHRLARRFRNRGEALEDLQQVADNRWRISAFSRP